MRSLACFPVAAAGRQTQAENGFWHAACPTAAHATHTAAAFSTHQPRHVFAANVQQVGAGAAAREALQSCVFGARWCGALHQHAALSAPSSPFHNAMANNMRSHRHSPPPPPLARAQQHTKKARQAAAAPQRSAFYSAAAPALCTGSRAQHFTRIAFLRGKVRSVLAGSDGGTSSAPYFRGLVDAAGRQMRRGWVKRDRANTAAVPRQSRHTRS